MEKVQAYMEAIVRNQLSLLNGVNPVDVKDSEIEYCLLNKECGNYKLYVSESFPSFENGVKKTNVNCAFICKDKGYHYCTNVIELN